MACLPRRDARYDSRAPFFNHTAVALMKFLGIADGSGTELLDIIALNVRTEIAFGQFSDGCTSLSWKTEKRSFLGQNWDVSVHPSGCLGEKTDEIDSGCKTSRRI
jgi:hypothetical protein